jgi:hypothetical protein
MQINIHPLHQLLLHKALGFFGLKNVSGNPWRITRCKNFRPLHAARPVFFINHIFPVSAHFHQRWVVKFILFFHPQKLCPPNKWTRNFYVLIFSCLQPQTLNSRPPDFSLFFWKIKN